MPQKSKDKTQYDLAREALEKLKEAMDASDKKAAANGATKQDKDAATHAKSRYDAELPKVQRLGFKQIAGMRTTKAIIAIRALAKTANRRAYNFAAADVDKMEKLLMAELTALKGKFQTALEGKSAAPATVKVEFD